MGALFHQLSFNYSWNLHVSGLCSLTGALDMLHIFPAVFTRASPQTYCSWWLPSFNPNCPRTKVQHSKNASSTSKPLKLCTACPEFIISLQLNALRIFFFFFSVGSVPTTHACVWAQKLIPEHSWQAAWKPPYPCEITASQHKWDFRCQAHQKSSRVFSRGAGKQLNTGQTFVRWWNTQFRGDSGVYNSYCFANTFIMRIQ